MEDQELRKLSARVANLEVALHSMWIMLKYLQPPETQEDIENMMIEHLEATLEMGVAFCDGQGFERA